MDSSRRAHRPVQGHPDYQPDRAASFRSFAEFVRDAPIINAIKDGFPPESSPLNSYVSVQLTVPPGRTRRTGTLADLIHAGRSADPVTQVISAEELESLTGCLTTLLSPLESKVLQHYLEGMSYEAIAAQIGHDTKTVDNALQRVKRKVTVHLESRRVSERSAIPPARAGCDGQAPTDALRRAPLSGTPLQRPSPTGFAVVSPRLDDAARASGGACGGPPPRLRHGQREEDAHQQREAQQRV